MSSRRHQAAGLQTRQMGVYALAVAVGGMLIVIARTIPGLGWLTYVSLVPLFMAIGDARPVPASLYGVLWGGVVSTSLALSGVHDAPFSLPLLIAPVVTGLYGFGACILVRRIGFQPLVLASGWMLVELLVSGSGLRGGLAGGIASHGHVMPFIADLFGLVLVAFLLAWVNAWLVEIVIRARQTWAAAACSKNAQVTTHKRLLPQLFGALSSCSLSPNSPRAPP